MRFTDRLFSRPLLRAVRASGLCALLCGLAMAATAAPPADPATPSWGAIAQKGKWYGYAFNHKTRADAERAARSQCDRSAGRSGTCDVRAFFERSCGALATGNFGEWATGNGASADAAGKAAAAQCNSFLPTEPCKVVVSVCSPR